MCTLTIVPTETGYLAGMNRDELRSRAAALPSMSENRNGVQLIFPRETGGGTWIACNSHGNLLALLNWNLPTRETRSGSLVSRGTIIPQLISASDSEIVHTALSQMGLASLAPFQLVSVFREEALLCEWRWDGQDLARKSHPWERKHWFSSSVSDESAGYERGRTCELLSRQWPPGQSWVRRLHRSHTPQAGAFSLCVHRADAATVSYTEVRAESATITMSYIEGSPCQKEEFDRQITLPLESSKTLALAS